MKIFTIFIIFVVTACSLSKSEEIAVSPDQSNLTEIQKYTANQWVNKNGLKLTYNDNPNLQLVFEVKIDSSKNRYILHPNIKIYKNDILKRAKNFAESKNVDFNKFIIQLLIRFIGSPTNKNSLYFQYVRQNRLLKK